MQRWNGSTHGIRSIDVRGLEEDAKLYVAKRCRLCDRRLPQGLPRAFCLEHSPYPQALLEQERRRRRSTQTRGLSEGE